MRLASVLTPDTRQLLYTCPVPHVVPTTTKSALRVGDVDAALPVGHVDALHVRVGGRRKQHHAHGGGQRHTLGEQTLPPRLVLVFNQFFPFL